MTKIVGILNNLDTAERQRVVRAAQILLGDSESGPIQSDNVSLTKQGEEEKIDGLNPQARKWASKNGITQNELDGVFHIDGQKVEVVGSEIPGKGDKGKTHNVYILEGIRRLLETGVASFDDKAARELCKNLGCYNSANHAVYMKEKRKELAGSKENGWKLTNPGLKKGASLVKEIAKVS